MLYSLLQTTGAACGRKAGLKPSPRRSRSALQVTLESPQYPVINPDPNVTDASESKGTGGVLLWGWALALLLQAH
jgi:hypothetical protein